MTKGSQQTHVQHSNGEDEKPLQHRLSALRFSEVKKRVFSDPYPFFPHYKVSKKLFDQAGENLLLRHAKRTLASKADFVELASGQKLLQANGICFAGTWEMGENSPYTGLYEKGVRIPAIVRASVSLNGTTQSEKRAFAIAVKLFPSNQHSVNFFLMHSLGGTRTKHVLSLPLTNEPQLGELPPFSQLFTAYRLEQDLESADKMFSGDKANARFRPVSHLADINTESSISPYWLRATASSQTPLVDKDDFREELNVAHYPNREIVLDIHAAPFNANGADNAVWQDIGRLKLTESVVSLTCDTRLHFAHPTIH